jgi:hypothetical protein
VSSSFRLGTSCAVGAALLWGLGTVASAAVLDRGIPSGPFTLVEFVRQRRLHWRVEVLGILEPGLTYYLAGAGLARTSASHAAVIAALEPVLVAVLGWLVFHNALPTRVLVPMLAILAGMAAVVTRRVARWGRPDYCRRTLCGILRTWFQPNRSGATGTGSHSAPTIVRARSPDPPYRNRSCRTRWIR